MTLFYCDTIEFSNPFTNVAVSKYEKFYSHKLYVSFALIIVLFNNEYMLFWKDLFMDKTVLEIYHKLKTFNNQNYLLLIFKIL